jgi:hypothetical protein
MADSYLEDIASEAEEDTKDQTAEEMAEEEKNDGGVMRHGVDNEKHHLVGNPKRNV